MLFYDLFVTFITLAVKSHEFIMLNNVLISQKFKTFWNYLYSLWYVLIQPND